jgi:glycosyltransferase involved in cell wall biosynthesis
MKISAIIPAYNSAAFIGDAIASIRCQTFPVSEIIVVDDGSTDDTGAAVKNADPTALYLRQENQGPSSARNRGVENAGGDWIAFLDADDQWTPGKTEEQIKALKNSPELQLVASDMAEIDHTGTTITPSVLAKHQLLPFFQELQGGPIPNALARLMQKNFIPTGTVLVRRNTLLEKGLFKTDIRYGEDLELWARIAADHPIACLPRVHMLRRQHGLNATQSTLPLLTDLVAVTRSIRKCCGDRLQQQGVNSDKMVADALWELGYRQFTNGDYGAARESFAASARERPSKRARLYRLATYLPTALIGRLKRLKQGTRDQAGQ